MPCNEADAVKLTRLEGKKMTIKMKFKTDKNILVVFSIENKYTLESRAKK